MQILTSKGFRDFDGIVCNGLKEVADYDVDGKQLTATLEHRIMVDNDFCEIAEVYKGRNYKKELVYDAVNVDDGHEYLTNGIPSHNCVYADEFAHIPNTLAEEFFKSSFPTISSGKTTKMLITSTPKGLNLFYKMWDDAIKGKNAFFPIECHWYDPPGRDEKWKEEQINILGKEGFAQEFECEFIGSGSTLIYGQVLRRLTTNEPISTNADGTIKIYKYPEPHKIYALTVDTGGGRGLDYSTFVVTDVTSLPYEVVATFRSNMIEPTTYAEYIVPVARQYNNAWVLCEVNSIGGEVASSIALDYEYENILTTINKGGRVGQTLYTGFNRMTKYGLNMDVKSKALGCAFIKQLIENDQFILNDYELFNEFTRFSRKGRSWAAEEGAHDDLVMCSVIFGWLANQPLFKELTDTDMRAKIVAQRQKEIEAETNFIGFSNLDEESSMSGIDLSMISPVAYPSNDSLRHDKLADKHETYSSMDEWLSKQ